MYTRQWCGYCYRRRSRLLREEGHRLRGDRLQQSDPKTREWLTRATEGNRRLPQIFIGEKSIGGFSDLSAARRGGHARRVAAPGRLGPRPARYATNVICHSRSSPSTVMSTTLAGLLADHRAADRRRRRDDRQVTVAARAGERDAGPPRAPGRTCGLRRAPRPRSRRPRPGRSAPWERQTLSGRNVASWSASACACIARCA